MDKPSSSLARLAELRARAATAASAAPPTLVLASKSQPASRILPLLAAGQRHFAENRVAEAAAKWPRLKQRFPATELHMIGVLQTGKLKQALGLFAVLQTLASERLARALAAQQARGAAIPRLWLQINLAQESHKPGLAPDAAAPFLTLLARLGLHAEGLMCLPPKEADPAPYFAALALLGRRLSLPFLSMGMSRDYEIAAQLGATHIRPGEAVFGSRTL